MFKPADLELVWKQGGGGGGETPKQNKWNNDETPALFLLKQILRFVPFIY